MLLLVTGCGYRAPMYKTAITTDPSQYVSVREAYRELAALIDSDTGMPPTDSNTLNLLYDRRQKWELINHDLARATRSIYIDVYHFSQDSSGRILSDILKEKRAEGVDVRIIVDKGTYSNKERQNFAALREDSIDVRYFYFPKSLRDNLFPAIGARRDHRKITLIDGQTAYIGGRNIKDAYFFSWRDTDLRLSGPAVRDLGRVYMENQQRVAPELPPIQGLDEAPRQRRTDTLPGLRHFHDKTVQIVPDDPWNDRLPIRNAWEWAITHARSYFYIYSPYTPPPPSTLKALKAAAARGVDVRWILPAHNDVPMAKCIGEALYKKLLKAGVRIYEWQGEMMHAKQFIVDDYLMAVGSANMDNISFFLNLEVEALVYDGEIAAYARDYFLREIETDCHEVTLEEIKHWNVFRRIRNSTIRTLGGPIS